MDAYLPASQRRRQYDGWRAALVERRPHSPAAVGSSVTSDSQSIFGASDQSRSRS
jgi:hypothetical protein